MIGLDGDALLWYQWEHDRRPITRWREMKSYCFDILGRGRRDPCVSSCVGGSRGFSRGIQKEVRVNGDSINRN